MSIQLVKLRPLPDAKGPKDVQHHFVTATAKSVESLFANAERMIAENVKNEDQYNIYYTLCHCKIGTRQFEKAEVICFDIDGILTEQVLAYHEPIAAALKLKDLSKCIVTHSGNGLQIVLKLKKETTDKSFFKKHKKAYKHWCDRINESLEESGLPGKADTTVFEPARILRLPFTENRKPIWNPLATDTKVKKATLFNKHLEYCGFELLDSYTKSLLDNTDTSISEIQSYGTPDVLYIMNECGFMKHLKENQADIEEPLWYAGLGVASHFQDDFATCHEISKEHPEYIFEDCQEKAEQAQAYPRTCADIEDRWDGCKSCPHYKKVKSPLQLKSNAHIATANQGYTTLSPRGAIKRHHEDLRKKFAQDHPYKTVTDVDRVMVWEDGYYKPKNKREIEGYAQKHFEPVCESKTERAEFVGQVMAYNHVSKEWLTTTETTRGMINLKNGVLNVSTGELLPHNPEYAFQYILPYDYDPEATCPTWELMLNNLMDGRVDKINLIEEYLGFVLLGGDYNPNVALILSGEGNNGKSTLINALRMLVGEDNVSDVPIKVMSQRFGCGDMEGKLVNICEEEGPECFKDTSNFKKATGDSRINIERKFENSYSMLNRAKLILSFNETPHLFDTTEGMQRRLMILPMNVDLKREPEKRIDDIKAKLEKELSGILNRALDGLMRLRQKGFTKLRENGSLIRELVHDSDPVQYFWDEYCIDMKDDSKISLKELYTHFQAELEAGKENFRLSYRGFCKKIRKVSRRNGLEPVRMKIDGKSLEGFVGVQYVSEGVMPHDNY